MPTKHSRYGYSAVSDYETCPYKYRLKHLDKLETLPDYAPDNPLIVGTAFHLGIEKSVREAIDWYVRQFPVVSDAHENEIIKLEILIPKVRAMLDPRGRHETFVVDGDFIGTIDYLEPVAGQPRHWNLLDFKYCSAKGMTRYPESPQVHLYAHHFMRTRHERVDRLGYLCVPKTRIRQKKTEDLWQFRQRLIQTCEATEPTLIPVTYDRAKVDAFNQVVADIKTANQWPKTPNPLCDWCEFQSYCEKGDMTMILPSIERRDPNAAKRRKLWIYGPSFSGKTTMLDAAPNPLNLNSDGNVEFVTMQIGRAHV